ARFKSVEPAVSYRGVLIDPGIERKNVDCLEAMTQRDLIVVEIVRGRNLHTAGAELRIDVWISDNRDRALREWQRDAGSDQITVSVIIRMNGDRNVSEHRFGTCSGDDDVT